MFLRSRKRIVFSVMAALALFLAVTLITIYGSSYYALKKQNTEMLERYVEIYSLDSLPGEGLPSDMPPSLPPDAGALSEGVPGGALYQLSSFYSAAIDEDGSLLAADTGRSGIYQAEDIAALAREVLAGGKSAGMVDSLMFRIDTREDYTLVAFLDTTLTESNMSTLLLHTLIAGIIAILVFFWIAVFLAKRIIRPLEENDRRQKQFISDAEHELKTPISVVSANAELLSRELGENQWLANIQYENERMGDLVREMLDLSHAENSPQIPEEIDFSRLTEQEVLPFESMAFEHGLTITGNIAEKIIVKGNRHQLEQLVSILMDNAISHSSGGTEIGVTLKKDHKNAVLVVSNPGEEIPEAVRDRLFDRFYRLDKARGDSGGHFGLGLPIAGAIAEGHKGRIRIDCGDGRIIFSVTLPAEK